MKVCIYGAGVIGGILASAIERAGHDVSVIARGPNLEAIRAKGLMVRAGGESVVTHPLAVEHPADAGHQDLVIVATKTTSLRDVALHISPLLGPNTLVAFAVNGIFWFYGDCLASDRPLDAGRLDPDGLLHRFVGPGRALGIISTTGGKMIEPGVVLASQPNSRFIAGAALPDTQDRAFSVLGALNPVGIRLDISGDILKSMWLKYLNVVGNHATCAVTGATIAQVHGDPAMLDVQIGIVSEAYEVAVSHGFSDLGWDVDRARAKPATSNHKPSMLQDLELGKPIEIESTYLALQDLARQQGIATPTLDIVVAILALRARLSGSLS